jgi:riboflavin synthase
MFKDLSLTNLDWLKNPETFVPHDKDISIKEDLAVEWNKSGVDIPVEDRKPITIKDEMKIKNPWNTVEACIEAARVIMQQGIMGKDLLAGLRGNFTEEIIKDAVPSLKKLVASEGVVGTIAIDLRGKGEHDAMIKASSNSPYKKYFKCVLMTPEQALNSSLVEHRKGTIKASMEISNLDSLIANVDSETETTMIYKPLGLPVVAFRGDLDDTMYNDTLVEVGALEDITEDEKKTIEASSKDAYEKTKKLFTLINNKRKAKKQVAAQKNIKAKNKANEYKMMKSSLCDINFESAPPADLDGVEISNAPDIGLEKTSKYVEQPVNEVKPALADLEIEGLGCGCLDMDRIDVDPLDIYVDSPIDTIDVDPYAPINDSVYEGTDIIELEASKQKKSSMDFDLKADLDI